MTITIAPARNEYTATAGQTIFNYTFKIYTDSDLQVFVTPVGQEANDSTDEVTGFSVTGVGLSVGGSITLVTPANLNELVTIVSNIPGNRTTDYQNNGDFIPDTVNNDFDRTVSLVKQLADLQNRTLVGQKSFQNSTPFTLPAPEAENLMRWKSDLSGLENILLVNIGDATIGLNIGDIVALIDDGSGNGVFPEPQLRIGTTPGDTVKMIDDGFGNGVIPEINIPNPLNYSALKDNKVNAKAFGPDDIEYKASIANGPNNLPVVDPVGDPTGTWLLAQRGNIGQEFNLGYEPTTAQLTQMGALERNGSSLLDTDFPELLEIWGGKLYGNADATHFYLPDDRGKFERVWDHGAGVDPDSGARTDRGDGTTGDNVGTEQSDQFKEHNHDFLARTAASGSTNYPTIGSFSTTSNFTSILAIKSNGGNQTNPINIYKFGGIFVK